MGERWREQKGRSRGVFLSPMLSVSSHVVVFTGRYSAPDETLWREQQARNHVSCRFSHRVSNFHFHSKIKPVGSPLPCGLGMWPTTSSVSQNQSWMWRIMTLGEETISVVIIAQFTGSHVPTLLLIEFLRSSSWS